MTISIPVVDPETELLIALRDHLRSECGFDHATCDVELDEMAPATQGHQYVVVASDGMTPGSQHAPAGHTEHWIHTVEVIVCQRVGNVPRDRLRNKFTLQSSALNKVIRQIILAVGDGYSVLRAANLSLEAGGDSGRFVESLEFKRIEDKPRWTSSETFGGSDTGRTVLIRAVKFGGASYMRKW